MERTFWRRRRHAERDEVGGDAVWGGGPALKARGVDAGPQPPRPSVTRSPVPPNLLFVAITLAGRLSTNGRGDERVLLATLFQPREQSQPPPVLPRFPPSSASPGVSHAVCPAFTGLPAPPEQGGSSGGREPCVPFIQFPRCQAGRLVDIR